MLLNTDGKEDPIRFSFHGGVIIKEQVRNFDLAKEKHQNPVET